MPTENPEMSEVIRAHLVFVNPPDGRQGLCLTLSNPDNLHARPCKNFKQPTPYPIDFKADWSFREPTRSRPNG